MESKEKEIKNNNFLNVIEEEKIRKKIFKINSEFKKIEKEQVKLIKPFVLYLNSFVLKYSEIEEKILNIDDKNLSDLEKKFIYNFRENQTVMFNLYEDLLEVSIKYSEFIKENRLRW